MRLLIIEDEAQIVLPLKKALENKGFAVDYSLDGQEGYENAKINTYDCILLDLNLPGMDGIEIAKKLRKENINYPILMLTARNQPENIWEGFENGTDDYLTKPFDFKELLYRIQALIKRNSEVKSVILATKNITLDPKSFEVTFKKKQVKLNKKEFSVLEYLLRNKGRVVSAEELLEHIWDEDVNIFTQTIRTNIKTLRKKVDPKKEIITTVIGKGYLIKDKREKSKE